MKENIKKAILATFYKIRESKKVDTRDTIGIFINYIYKYNKMQYRTIRSKAFNFVFCEYGAPRFTVNPKYFNFPDDRVILDIIKNISDDEFYSLWLESSYSPKPSFYEYEEPLIDLNFSVEEFLKKANSL